MAKSSQTFGLWARVQSPIEGHQKASSEYLMIRYQSAPCLRLSGHCSKTDDLPQNSQICSHARPWLSAPSDVIEPSNGLLQPPLSSKGSGNSISIHNSSSSRMVQLRL